MYFPRLLATDQTYPDQFARSPLGVAKLHTLELDFGQAAPDGRRGFAAERLGGLAGRQHLPRGVAGRQGGLVMPYLQMQDAAGRWKTVDRRHGNAGRQAEDDRCRSAISSPPAARCASSPIFASTGMRSS